MSLKITSWNIEHSDRLTGDNLSNSESDRIKRMMMPLDSNQVSPTAGFIQRPSSGRCEFTDALIR